MTGRNPEIELLQKKYELAILMDHPREDVESLAREIRRHGAIPGGD